MRFFSSDETEKILDHIEDNEILDTIKRLDVKHKKIAESTVQVSKFLLDKRNEDQHFVVYSRRGVLTSVKLESDSESSSTESKTMHAVDAVITIKSGLSSVNR